MTQMTPQEIVSELDKHIIGQDKAKRAVSIALRNRWRRQQVDEPLRHEITPKNILMIGPTGVGKTEIARRLARLANAPFIKVEATKFTEVGYVGKDVDSIIRDLVEAAIKQERDLAKRRFDSRARDAAEERILDALLPPTSRAGSGAIGFGAGDEPLRGEDSAARQKFRKRLREGELDDKEIEIDLAQAAPAMELMGPAGMEEMTQQLQGLFQGMPGRRKARKLKIGDAMKQLVDEEAGKLVNDEEIKSQAMRNVEQNGIVFLDEIDKIAVRSEVSGADVSRQGVQRDLLPLVEGTTVNTRYGMVKTDHILFIAVGRLPSVQALGPDPGAAGAVPDPRRAGVAVGRRFRTDPDRDRREPDQAVPGTARHRGGAARVPAGRHPAAGADRLQRQRADREHRRAPAAHGAGAPAGGGLVPGEPAQRPVGRRRCRLRRRASRRDRGERGFVAVRALAAAEGRVREDRPTDAFDPCVPMERKWPRQARRSIRPRRRGATCGRCARASRWWA